MTPILRRAAPLLLALLVAAPAAAAPRYHGLAMHGEPKYPPGFPHLDYVRPDAPKGGHVTLSAIGSFDSLNPFILKGRPGAGSTMIYDTLLASTADEAFTEYGLLAESIEMPDDRSWVAFTLRPEARWHDGKPVTVEDVVWTFATLKEKGAPFYRAYYADVVKATAAGERTVRFDFRPDGMNRELPLIVGQMAVLPKHYWEGRDFTRTTLEPPLGSGPYRIKALDPGRFVEVERVADYWGRDLPINKGRYNFGTMRFDYYRDATVALEAFKASAYDMRLENIAKNWATAYDVPAVRDGRIKKEEIRHELPTGMQAFAYNTRRFPFTDRKVREALAFAFDFEWTNATLFYGAYARTESYFSNSELASEGLPGPEELKILEPFRDRLPPEVFTKSYAAPKSDGSGNNRENQRTALRLLREAGWQFKDGALRNAQGRAFEFEILLAEPSFERIVLPFAKSLERLGIAARVRTVDTAQYQNRVDAFDFDMVVASWGQSLSPGNEQRDFWHSEKADEQGSRNLAGIKDPVVDRLIDLVISAPDRESLVTRTRALDRVLLWGHYVIPHWHNRSFRIAYWDKFGRPATTPRYGLGFQDTWWVEPAKAPTQRERTPAN